MVSVAVCRRLEGLRTRAHDHRPLLKAGVVVVLAVAAVMAGASVLSGRPASAPSASQAPVADTFVRADRPRASFGSSHRVRIGRTPATYAYLRFRVGVPEGEVVTSATLRLFATTRSRAGFTVHRVASTSWPERTTTYANAPRIGARVAGSGPHRANVYVSVDVTALVTRNGPVSLAVKAASAAVSAYTSRHARSRPPALVVTTAPRSATSTGPAAATQPGGAAPRPPGAEAPPARETSPADGTGRVTVVLAVGDAADGSASSRALADYVVAQRPDRFLYLGDVYETGSAADFANNYDPLYGALTAKTDPVIGNHEYANRTTGYYRYWAAKRGWTPEQALHRSYVDEASGWQVVAYDSEADMAIESRWVAGELAKYAGTCRLVIAHRGRHVAPDGAHADNSSQEGVWRLIAGRTAINLVGHNHVYARLAPVAGVHVIVSGAGGHGLRPLGEQHHALAGWKTGVATATRLVLRHGAADFAQVGADGDVYDSGTVSCTPAR